MVLRLTNMDGSLVWINLAHIRKFYRHDTVPGTVIELTYGSDVVRETPEEIAAMVH